MVFRFILGDLILGMLRVKCVSNLEVNLYPYARSEDTSHIIVFHVLSSLRVVLLLLLLLL
jgi:hypothetical protein